MTNKEFQDMLLFIVVLVVAIIFWKTPPEKNDTDWK